MSDSAANVKDFNVTFVDEGNCDIFSHVATVYGWKTALSQSVKAYELAGHKKSEITEIRIIKIK